MNFTKVIYKRLPVTLDLARQHLRVGDATHDDALIQSKIEMAVAVAEDMTGRLIRQRCVVFDVLLNHAVESVKMPVHTEGVTEVSTLGEKIPKEKYTLRSNDFNQSLVVSPEFRKGKATVKAVVGYDSSTLPPAIKAAILFILGTLYDNESDNIVGRSTSELSLTAEKLLMPWRITPYGDV